MAMRRRRLQRTWLLVLGFAVSGCLHHSSEDQILDAFSDDTAGRIFDSDGQPQYLQFSDEGAERAFRGLMRDGRYRIAPVRSSLICPGVSATGMHGYVLGAGVDTVMGDSAFARVWMDCIRYPQTCANRESSCGSTSSGAVRIGTDYLLVRKRGKWKIEKPVSGSEVTL
jgi:hypothetical protein